MPSATKTLADMHVNVRNIKHKYNANKIIEEPLQNYLDVIKKNLNIISKILHYKDFKFRLNISASLDWEPRHKTLQSFSIRDHPIFGFLPSTAPSLHAVIT